MRNIFKSDDEARALKRVMNYKLEVTRRIEKC